MSPTAKLAFGQMVTLGSKITPQPINTLSPMSIFLTESSLTATAARSIVAIELWLRMDLEYPLTHSKVVQDFRKISI